MCNRKKNQTNNNSNNIIIHYKKIYLKGNINKMQLRQMSFVCSHDILVK